MKKINLVLLLLISIILFSCGNSSNTAASTPGTPPTETSSSGQNASFSVALDGTPVSGNIVDDMQLLNTVFIYPGKDDNSKRLLFFLSSNKQGDDFYSFRFSMPQKEGVYKFSKESGEACGCHLMVDYYLKSKDNYPRYNEDSITVSIDKISSTRISGTFAGRLKLSADTRSKPYPNSIALSDGKFDIPFSTGKLRPE